ncbi:neuronal calcium sensor [Sparganum proliferum]
MQLGSRMETVPMRTIPTCGSKIMGNALASRKKLPKEDLEFLMSNTHFTKKQIKQWYNGFIRDCPSGQLSKKKFIEVYSGFFPDGNAEEFCTHVFRTFDKDNSGKIDFKEFLLAINITSGGRPKEKLEWAYQMYDIDGNGTIERNEMVEIIRAIYSMLGADGSSAELSPEARTEEIFAKMDENKDGVLTRDEFMNGCLSDQYLLSMLLADEPAE